MSRWAVHVTTLSAGSIVIIATFAEKFEGRGPGFLLAIAAVGFAVAIGAGLVTALAAIFQISKNDWGTLGAVSMLVTLVAFAIALVSLAGFAAFAVT